MPQTDTEDDEQLNPTEIYRDRQCEIARSIHASPNFTKGEKRVLEYQLNITEERRSFFHVLMLAIHMADEGNQAKLALAFPEEVEAVIRWQRGDLATVWRNMGLDL